MAVPTCPETGSLVEAEIHRVLTQYRESPNLLGVIRTYLRQVEEVAQSICVIPSYFDIDTAIGDQLTLLGKRLGWPRCHCVCDVAPVFGFACPGTDGPPIVGFCEGGTWVNCEEVGNGDLCFEDDEVYRGYLKARRYQMLGLYDLASLQTALQHIWGPMATVTEAGFGRVVLSPGRALSVAETQEMPLLVRVMPIAPGIRATVHLSPGPIFGFGEGWAGFHECSDAGPVLDATILTASEEPITDELGSPIETVLPNGGVITGPAGSWLCPIDPHAYDCGDAGKIFGFCDGFYGFCVDAQWAC